MWVINLAVLNGALILEKKNFCTDDATDKKLSFALLVHCVHLFGVSNTTSK